MGAFGIRLVLIAAVCAAGGPGAQAAPLSGGLHRPLRVPHISPGAPCPVSHADTSVDFARFGIAVGLGGGPVYPVGMPRGVLYLQPAGDSDAGSPWAGAKVLWFVHPRYHGPVLIRGRRLDGPGLVRFDRGQVPSATLSIRSGGLDRPSSTRLRGPGCYGYQIDGTSFSRIVVFRAVMTA